MKYINILIRNSNIHRIFRNHQISIAQPLPQATLTRQELSQLVAQMVD
jgi:hypothetical protein